MGRRVSAAGASWAAGERAAHPKGSLHHAGARPGGGAGRIRAAVVPPAYATGLYEWPRARSLHTLHKQGGPAGSIRDVRHCVDNCATGGGPGVRPAPTKLRAVAATHAGHSRRRRGHLQPAAAPARARWASHGPVGCARAHGVYILKYRSRHEAWE